MSYNPSVITTTSDTYANRPAAGTSGRLFYATNIGVLFRDTGAAWTVIADPWGFKFFSDEGFLPANVSVAGLTTIPAFDGTITQVGDTGPTITDSVVKIVASATAGSRMAWWDLGALKSKILVVVSGCWGNRNGGAWCGPFVGALPVSDIDDAYAGVVGPNESAIYKESAGYTQLATQAVLTRVDNVSTLDGYIGGQALYYDDATGALKLFMRIGAHEWAEVVSTTDSTFTTMRYAGISQGGPSATYYAFGPIFVFSE